MGATAPDLRGLRYQEPSWYARVRSRSHAVIVSLGIVGLVMICIGCFWVGYNRGLVKEQYSQARLAAKKGDYQTALECYQKSLALHERLFDREGQVQDLIEQSRCLSEQGMWAEALVRLQRAAEFGTSPEVKQAMEHVEREKGLATLEQAEFELRALSFKKARELAESAIDSFQSAGGTPEREAAAHRVAALAGARLGEDKKVERHLKWARELEGDSSANRAVRAKVKGLAEERRKEREVALHKNKARGAVVLAKAREQARAREREWSATRASYTKRGGETASRPVYPIHSDSSQVRIGQPPDFYYPTPPAPYIPPPVYIPSTPPYGPMPGGFR